MKLRLRFVAIQKVVVHNMRMIYINQKNKSILINGCLCKIQFNKSNGKEWRLENANIKTIEIIDKLLLNKDSDFKFDKGITVINPLTTLDLNLLVTRPSNHIGIIRASVGSNTLITYHKPNQLPLYGIIKSKENINKLLELKKRILTNLELNQHKKKKEKISAFLVL